VTVVGDELTSGKPDRKEGLYCGIEHDDNHPLVLSGTPLHGKNQFPERPAALRDAVLTWIEAVTRLAQRVMRGVALGLGLPHDWFARHLTGDPTVLFRIFHYPPGDDSDWGVAEHTDCVSVLLSIIVNVVVFII
jgi:isopenicillin N synthase-like dioxygenase